MGKAKRKVKPQPPWHFWYDVDGCWFCKKKTLAEIVKYLNDILPKSKTLNEKLNGD